MPTVAVGAFICTEHWNGTIEFGQLDSRQCAAFA